MQVMRLLCTTKLLRLRDIHGGVERPVAATFSFPRSRIVNELPFRLPARLWPVFCSLLGRLTPVKFCDDLRADAVELLLREDTQQRPGEVQRIEDRPALVRAYNPRRVWACEEDNGRSRSKVSHA